MGLWAKLLGREGPATGTIKEVSCQSLFDAAAEVAAYELAWAICVDMVATAIGRCEFRTYRNSTEVQEREAWMWNVEPNLNENSTVFLHKLVSRLYRDNEALVVSFRNRDGYEMVAVADSWEQSEPQVTRLNEYRNVTVDGYTFGKRFREDDVLHLRLHQDAIRPVLARMGTAWQNMVALAKAHYEWDQGQHWKVHIDQLASGADGFETDFAAMIQQQVKPFLTNPNGVLPEFDGYKYDPVGGSNVGTRTSADVRELVADIFDFTARGFLIPAVLVNGKVESTEDANSRFLTLVVDPICDQLQEEINRKRYGFDAWQRGDYLRVDSSTIIHYDLFDQAASVEKLVGSGVYTINNILRAVGQSPINEPWADKHYLTLNITEIGQAVTPLGK